MEGKNASQTVVGKKLAAHLIYTETIVALMLKHDV
jgi:hypothetical protein